MEEDDISVPWIQRANWKKQAKEEIWTVHRNIKQME